MVNGDEEVVDAAIALLVRFRQSGPAGALLVSTVLLLLLLLLLLIIGVVIIAALLLLSTVLLLMPLGWEVIGLRLSLIKASMPSGSVLFPDLIVLISSTMFA
jgi:hypothetical protein